MEECPLYIAFDYAYLDPSQLTTKVGREYLSKPVVNVFEHVLDSLLEETKADGARDHVNYYLEQLKKDYNYSKTGENYSFGLYALDKDSEEIIPLNYISEKKLRVYNEKCFLDFPNAIRKENIKGHEREIIYLCPIINIGCG
ncbi:TPA: hypothetical protein HA239_02910 [Candidatus Woesearchaeota archaeon]|nr:hypothetical protein QT06_C0001G0657 [archaeon GW2011_AR15]MBS3103556.1 hypothetical protein [Candidatus Woesearchaeota archaeon]HIH41340.1 hypothetical protein [Candidatus Woesearchaeota archaeon]